jgi:hypothetical protein
MPNLNEYLGSIVSSITNARVLSDLQTVKIAEQYANHALLKHFSIPRMRIEDIEMTIPVGMNVIDNEGTPTIEPINSNELVAAIYKVVIGTLGISRVASSVASLFQTEINEKCSALIKSMTPQNYKELTLKYSNALGEICFSIAKEHNLIKKSVKIQVTPTLLAQNIERNIISKVIINNEASALENLNVIVEANKLRELAPESLIYIKMKISEDGMEWNHAENSKGEIVTKLLPESILHLINILQAKLIEFPELVNSLERKEASFLNKLFLWMKTIEDIMSTYSISETSEIAGLRSKIIAERFNENNGASKKKMTMKVASEILYDLQKTTLNVLKPYEIKTEESRELIRQLLLIISEMKVIFHDDNQPFESLVNTIWQFIFANDQLKAGGIKLKTNLPINDIRLLIAEEINLEDFHSTK